MNKYEVFLDSENSVCIQADRVDDGSNHLYFQKVIDNGNNTRTYLNIASFPFANICGWILLENKIVK